MVEKVSDLLTGVAIGVLDDARTGAAPRHPAGPDSERRIFVVLGAGLAQGLRETAPFLAACRQLVGSTRSASLWLSSAVDF